MISIRGNISLHLLNIKIKKPSQRVLRDGLNNYSICKNYITIPSLRLAIGIVGFVGIEAELCKVI